MCNAQHIAFDFILAFYQISMQDAYWLGKLSNVFIAIAAVNNKFLSVKPHLLYVFLRPFVTKTCKFVVIFIIQIPCVK